MSLSPLKGLSHKNQGRYCCISIENSFQGLGMLIINFNVFKGTLRNFQKAVQHM